MHLRVFLVAQLLFLIHSNGSSSLSRDSITPTEPLKDGQVLVSGDSSAFALGFFSPGNSTGRRYVGIWYNKVSEQTVVWVANRDRPVNGTDGVLSVTEDGNLILSSGNFTLWSTELGDNQLNNLTSTESRTSPSPGAGPRAILLDSGNLEVRLAGSQSASWQSFDHPVNVFLPGMQLGVNRRTGLSHSLNSWRSEDDPGRGNYTFRVGPGSGPPEFYVYKDGSSGPIWRTGPWVGGRWSGVPEMTRGYIFNYTFVDSGDVVYATYGIRNPSVVSIFMLDGESGTVQRKTWHQSSSQWTKFWAAPLQDCDQYANCGPFGLCTSNQEQFECSCLTGYEPKSARDWYLRDGRGGCRRAGNISMCGNGEGFLKLSNVKVPDTTKAMSNMSMSLEDCREKCFKNCSCTAFTTATDTANGATGCIWFHGDLLDTREYDIGAGQDLFFRVDKLVLAKSLDTSKAHLNKKHLAIILVCALVAFAFSIFFVIWLYRKRRRDYKEQKQRSLWLGEDDESNSKSDLPVFPRSAIVTATQNFDPANLLGQGGFGPVYKGKLSNGMEIAVKRLSKYSGQGINEFKNEVRLIAKLQHRNLVKTLGCCVRGEEKMLVYEYLPNKSLDNYIFDEEKRKLLDWRTRYEIILGIAKGVLYLHQDSTLKIIHRDLKASNILLDEKMVPKISDFGMARIFGNDQSEANTNRVVGTYGYMSPEYAMEGHFSIKSDVFSFGVILLEIISGKKSSGYYNDNASTNLSGYAWKLWQEGKRLEIVDESVRWSANSSEDEILRCIQIGLLCVQESPEERPSMLDVIFMLNNKLDLRNPNEPAFIVKGNQHKYEDSLSSSTQAHSVNDITITDVDGR